MFYVVGIGLENIYEYLCGYVILLDYLLVLVMKFGFLGVDFDFIFFLWENFVLLNELGLVISNVCNIIFGGVVCFFLFYKY